MKLRASVSVSPGERFELENLPAEELARGVLVLDPGLQALFSGQPVEVEFDAGDGTRIRLGYAPEEIALSGLPPGVSGDRLALECVQSEPLRFLLRVAQREAPRQNTPLPEPSASDVRFTFSIEDPELLNGGSLARARVHDVELSLLGTRLSLIAGFDALLAPQLMSGVEPLEYQQKTAATVLRRFRGRALLADEVGLGKTIEAGMVLLELVARGLVRKVLVLTPPSLVEQWRMELAKKFGLDFIAFDAEEFKEQGVAAWSTHDRIIASFHTAKRQPQAAAVTDRDWDMVIIDEAHHFRNRNTLLWKLGAALKTQYMLLLTATPVQNNIEELYSLVTLIKPGLLHTSKMFQREFVNRSDKLAPKNLDQLHRLLSDVMVRNRRANTGVAFTRRIARSIAVRFPPPERDLYAAVSRFVHAGLRESRYLSRMTLLTVQKELGSSPQAAATTLRKVRAEVRNDPSLRSTLGDLADAADGISSGAKLDRLVALIREFPDQMLVFTQFRDTLAAIVDRLNEEGISVIPFHGGLTRIEKEQAVRRFRDGARVMVSTDAGSEGRNLQFCNAITNFDLPWNPMLIEQRIGRLSRIGQHRDVHVFNLVAAETLEAAILHLLEAKIAMFELVVGEIDMILGTMEEEKQFEEIVTDLWIHSETDEQFRTELDRLGDRLLDAKEAYLAEKELDEKLFGGALEIKP